MFVFRWFCCSRLPGLRRRKKSKVKEGSPIFALGCSPQGLDQPSTLGISRRLRRVRVFSIFCPSAGGPRGQKNCKSEGGVINFRRLRLTPRWPTTPENRSDGRGKSSLSTNWGFLCQRFCFFGRKNRAAGFFFFHCSVWIINEIVAAAFGWTKKCR